MIIWINCKISNTRHKQTRDYKVPERGNLPTEERFDVARYSFASYVPLEPFISKIIFSLVLDDCCAGREQEMEDWINGLFPKDKTMIIWRRYNNAMEWREIQPVIDSIDDDLLWMQGVEDHPFIGSEKTLPIYEEGLKLLSQDPDPRAALHITHYPEIMRQAHYFGGTISECGNFASFIKNSCIGGVVAKKSLFHGFLEKNKDPYREVYRMCQWENEEIYTKVIVPTVELGRHYDGYGFREVDHRVCPSLVIPPGFFEKNIVIRYGFDDRDPNCVNINPMAPNFYSVDLNGIDYKFGLDDIPAFWKPYIKRIDIADDVDLNELNFGRDQHFIELASSGLIGGSGGPPIPREWIINHLITK